MVALIQTCIAMLFNTNNPTQHITLATTQDRLPHMTAPHIQSALSLLETNIDALSRFVSSNAIRLPFFDKMSNQLFL
jgi:hypothetical protein